MSSDLKTSFELEPNPFERSFASKEPGESAPGSTLGLKTLSTSSVHSANNNKHNLHIPNLSSLNPPAPGAKLPGITPPLFTPGGRRLPPLGLSPGAPMNPDTPGTNLWNSLLSATNNGTNGNGNVAHQENGQSHLYPQNHNNYNQFANNLRKTGLTPNESNLRSGLTPGGISQSSYFANGVPGLTTPSALLNSPMTPGLSSLLGITQYPNQNQNNQQQQPNGQQQQNPQQHPQQNPHQQPQQHPQNPQQQHHPNKHQLHQPNQVPNQQPIPQPSVQGHLPSEQSPRLQNFKQAPQHPHPGQQIHPQQHQQQQQQQLHSDKLPQQHISTIPEEPYVKVEDSGALKRKASAGSPQEPKKRKEAKRKGKKVEKDEGDDESDDATSPNGSRAGGDKRKSALERNRVAASKCRQRKKLQLQKMEDELAFYSTGYRELSAQVQQLREQLITFKGIIVGHKDCAMLTQSVGGYDALNNIIQQANYVTQSTIRSLSNATSIPSTIPTTLNAPTESYQGPPPAPTSGMPPGLPVHLNNPGSTESHTNSGSTRSSTSMTHGGVNFPANSQTQNAPIVSHSSMIDLPASLANGQAATGQAINGQGLDGQGNNDRASDLRAIHSMTNLAAQQQPQYNDLTGFNLRTVNSMVDLQLHHPN